MGHHSSQWYIYIGPSLEVTYQSITGRDDKFMFKILIYLYVDMKHTYPLKDKLLLTLQGKKSEVSTYIKVTGLFPKEKCHIKSLLLASVAVKLDIQQWL